MTFCSIAVPVNITENRVAGKKAWGTDIKKRKKCLQKGCKAQERMQRGLM